MIQPPNPRHARFLSAEEKDIVVYRVDKEAGSATMNRLDRSSLFRSLGDWKIWVAFVYPDYSEKQDITTNAFIEDGYAISVPTMEQVRLLLSNPPFCNYISNLIFLFMVGYANLGQSNQLGYSAAEAQIHAIPIYIVAVVISLSACFLSSRFKHRYVFFLIGTALAIIGWSVELAQVTPVGIRYFGMFSVS